MLEQLASAAAERREMLAGLTHDLRAPLTRLRLRLALLESDLERAGLVRDIDAMERIVGQCLAFLRSEEPGQTPPPIVLATLLADEIGRQRELGRPLALTISDAAATMPGGDRARQPAAAARQPDRQRAAARRAAGRGRARFRAHPAQASLRVRDHGPGIAGGDRDRALEPFAQLEPARATDGSCGLGLAIVRRIATGCGGEVTLRDAADGGLEVVVHLPTC
jgi:two-component system osmolarity sensor histidine kinase EnvZ